MSSRAQQKRRSGAQLWSAALLPPLLPLLLLLSIPGKTPNSRPVSPHSADQQLHGSGGGREKKKPSKHQRPRNLQAFSAPPATPNA